MIRDELYVERIDDPRKRNQQLLRAYLAFFTGPGYHPTPPNANVLAYPVAEYVLYEEDHTVPWVWRSNIGALLLPTPATVTVPNVVGLNIADAQTALANSFLSTINLVDSSTFVPYNQVVSQSVPAGTVVPVFTQITLSVQDLTLVPQVTGLDQATATAVLTAAFLQTAVLTQVGLPVGIVALQDVSPGTQLLGNSTVTITVNIGGVGFRVMAVTAGTYQGLYYNPGDVFDLTNAVDFSDATQNYEDEGAEYAAGWMLPVPAQTQLTQPDGNATFPAVDPNRRFVE